MKLKIVFFLMMSFTSLALWTDLAAVREEYREAPNNEKTTKKLYDELTSIAKNDKAVFVAYKGAVTTLMAKYASGIKDKKNFFKDGKELLEYAIAAEPENVEIRCIRLSVQENAPKITGYHKNIEEDKQFILANYDSMTEEGAKSFVKGYVSQSDGFSTAEKQLL